MNIVQINTDNYCRFTDMLFWRETGNECPASNTLAAPRIAEELSNPNL